jgi:hypothetical protein
MRTIMAALVAGGLLNGCGWIFLGVVTGEPGALSRLSDGTEIVTGACLPATASATCLPISKTNNPADEEAWRYVAKMEMRTGWGAPAGEAPVDIYVLGPVERCQKVVQQVRKVPEDRGRRCDGPFYFKRG